MKRLTSLDFIRGVLVIGMTTSHVVLLNVDFTIPSDLSSLTPIQMVLGAIFINFTHWRGFFFLVSGTASYFSLLTKLEQGKSRGSILKNQLLAGFILIIIGKLYVTFFYFWGMIDEWTRLNGWNWDLWPMFYFVDTIESLGFITIFAGIIFYLITIKKGQHRWKLNTIVAIGISNIIFFVHPYIHDSISVIAGIDLARSTNFDAFGYGFDKEIGEKIIRVFLNALVGREAPLFPMLGVYFMGTAIAFVLKNPKPTRKHLRLLYIPCILMIGVAGYEALWVIGFENLDPFFYVFPRWYSFFSIGTQMMIVIVFLIYIEFNPRTNEKRWLNGTRYIRRFSIFALTVYWFQLLEAIPRNLLMMLFDIDTTIRFNLNLGWSLILMFVTLGMWSGILYVFDRYLDGIGSLEWVILQFRSVKKINEMKRFVRLNISEKLQQVEMIRFLPEQHEQL